MRYSFDNALVPTTKDTQYYTMLGSRGIWHRGWKANTTHPTISDWGHFHLDHWELFNVDEDRSENRDLADQNPEKLEELKELWFVEAGRNNGLPLEDRSPVKVLTSPRPQLAKPRERYVFFPGTEPVPESVAPVLINRSFKIGALIDSHPGAEGVLFNMGTRFGGHALYIKDGRLKYVNNFVGLDSTIISSEETVPSGENLILAAAFDKEGEKPAGVAFGTLSLYINEKKVGEGKIRTQPGRFGLGSYITVGRSYGSEVTDDFPAERPWAFTGTVKRVAIDVSGREYIDIEKEARAILARF